jgi:hypothetical protein
MKILTIHLEEKDEQNINHVLYEIHKHIENGFKSGVEFPVNWQIKKEDDATMDFMNPKDRIEQAKKTLSEAGYYTENLWQINDVKSKFNCTDVEAMQVLDISLNEDYTKETINETISNNGDAMGLTHKD